MVRSALLGVLAGFVLLFFLSRLGLGIVASLIAGFVAGFFAGGGAVRGFMAASLVWFLNFFLSAIFIGSSWSWLLGGTGGMAIGLGAAGVLSLLSILDIFACGFAGMVGGLFGGE